MSPKILKNKKFSAGGVYSTQRFREVQTFFFLNQPHLLSFSRIIFVCFFCFFLTFQNVCAECNQPLLMLLSLCLKETY